MQGRRRRNAQGPIGNQFRRLRKRTAKKQIPRRPRLANVGTRAGLDGSAEIPARDPMRCAFGATRVGALLGRVRLHVQTDRFLAVHRGDEVWANSCLEAALALAEVVSRMTEEEMAAALPSRRAEDKHPACGAAMSRAANGSLPGNPLPDEIPQGHPPSHVAEDERWGTRKTGTVTLARYSAELERSTQ